MLAHSNSFVTAAAAAAATAAEQAVSGIRAVEQVSFYIIRGPRASNVQVRVACQHVFTAGHTQ